MDAPASEPNAPVPDPAFRLSRSARWAAELGVLALILAGELYAHWAPRRVGAVLTFGALLGAAISALGARTPKPTLRGLLWPYCLKVACAGIGALVLHRGFSLTMAGLRLLGGWAAASALLEGVFLLLRTRRTARALRAAGSFASRWSNLPEIFFEAALLGALAFAFRGYRPGSLPDSSVRLAASAWAGAGLVLSPFRARLGRWASHAAALAAVAVCLGASLRSDPAPAAGCVWFVAAAAVLLALAHLGFRLLYRGARPQMEWLRWLLLGCAAGYVLHPFVVDTLHGTSDALWYATLQEDAVAQAREGVYPVLNGQGIAQFNGSIYPYRIAPALHNLAIAVDQLSLHSLAPIALQNLTLVLVGLAAFASAYLSLAHVSGRRDLVAVLSAIVFLSCPGVIGILYNTDLYMSWTTVPLVPLAWLGFILCFQGTARLAPAVLMGSALGALWWGHTPIAMWVTSLAGLGWAAVGLRHRHDLGGLARLSAAAALSFAATCLFPIVSVKGFPPEAQIDASDFQRAEPQTVVYFLQQAFPGVLRPLSDLGRTLSDFQFGYALLLLLPLALVLPPWRELRSRGRLGALLWLSAASLGLIVLLTPVPGLCLFLWAHVPAIIRNATSNWVMNRLYLVGASTIIFSLAVALSVRRRLPAVFLLALAACAALSLQQVGRFIHGSYQLRPAPGSGVAKMRPENLSPTRFAYNMFTRMPPIFNHGVTDPLWEHRILSPDGARVLADNASAARNSGKLEAQGRFLAPAPGSVVWHLDRTLRLEPGVRYVVDIRWSEPTPVGVLQFLGPSLNRVYGIPDYGEPLSFGAGGSHRPWLSLFSTVPGGETIQVLFHANGGMVPSSVGTLRLLAYSTDALPVRVDSWIRYDARVTSPAPGLLEIPRMYQDRYGADVDGRPVPVVKSPFGLTAVPIPAGTSEVVLQEPRPLLLVVAFWLSGASIVCLLPAAFCRVIREGPVQG